jgi:hypothetical protein
LFQCFDYPNYFRIVLTVPELQLREACHRISQFCMAHYVAPINLGKEEAMSDSHIHHELHNGIATVIEP